MFFKKLSLRPILKHNQNKDLCLFFILKFFKLKFIFIIETHTEI